MVLSTKTGPFQVAAFYRFSTLDGYADLRSPHYRPGISCAYYHKQRSEEDGARYAERHRQAELAGKLGARPHIGTRPCKGSLCI